MVKFRGNLLSKTAAFVFIVICCVAVILSSLIVFLNAGNQWYSKSDETVQNDIYGEVAYYAQDVISEQFYMYESQFYENEEKGQSKIVIGENDLLIFQKDESKNLGYKITLQDSVLIFESDGKETSERTVNADIIDESESYHNKYDHSHMVIDVYLGKIEKGSVPEELLIQYDFWEKIYDYRYYSIVAAAAGLLCAVFLCTYLFSSIGRQEKIMFLHLPVEIALAFCAAVFVCMIFVSNELVRGFESNYEIIVILAIIDIAAACSAILGMALITVIKIRQNNLWESSVMFQIWRFIKWSFSKILYVYYKLLGIIKKICKEALYIVKSIPLVWKTCIVVLIGIFINLFITVQISINGFLYNNGMWLMWFTGAVVVFVIVIYFTLGLHDLREGGKHLAAGDLDYIIDKKRLYFELADHADDLNNISSGMAKAVDDKIKSERFKTELITNVSHDIKTPLTSIINYIDFLKQEEFEDERINEYINILDKQSNRLKKLTEDLIEASKAATGNIKLDMKPCDAGMLMRQMAGEYEERLEKEKLTLVSRFPEKDVEIMADSRSMWRILDNIMNNICKYSQPGTRVYQELQQNGDDVCFIYRNTSKYELNISGDELMERFVRGDSARHTEGSGLGLSIAINLAELQHGNLKVYVDGDLFKVIMRFKSI